MYDAIIVGARCAGSPTAMLLARKGYRVLVVDRATFPSDTFRNHAVMYPGLRMLREWGLLDRVIASNATPLRHITYDMADFPLESDLPAADGIDALYAPRRIVLDKILVDAAREAGAEVREGFAVQDLLWEGDRVVGIRGRSHGGELVEEHAHIVIGADGLHSVVAREVGAPTYDDHPNLTCAYYSYWSGIPMQGLEVYRQDDIMLLAFPTNDNLTCVAMQAPNEAFAHFRADTEGTFNAYLTRFPQMESRVQAGQRAERWLGTGELPNFFRQSHGPGWALVGDAGYHKDPVLANGISDAFRSADLLADAVDAGLSGRQSLALALEMYEAQRNALVAPSYAATIQAATWGPVPAEMLGLRAALRHNPAAATQFFGTIFGGLPPQEFFAPENMERIMVAALQGAPA